MAAGLGHQEVLAYLLKKGASPNALPTNEGDTPLSAAIQGGHFPCVTTLVDAGADVNYHSEKQPVTPLISAAIIGHLDMVKLFVTKGAHIDYVAENSSSALISAAYEGHDAIVTLLIKNSAALDLVTSSNGLTALMSAACQNHLQVATSLLEAGAPVDQIHEDDGMTALMMAAGMGYRKMVNLLLKYKADINATAKSGESVLCLTLASGRWGIAQLLLDRGAQVTQHDISLTTQKELKKNLKKAYKKQNDKKEVTAVKATSLPIPSASIQPPLAPLAKSAAAAEDQQTPVVEPEVAAVMGDLVASVVTNHQMADQEDNKKATDDAKDLVAGLQQEVAELRAQLQLKDAHISKLEQALQQANALLEQYGSPTVKTGV